MIYKAVPGTGTEVRFRIRIDLCLPDPDSGRKTDEKNWKQWLNIMFWRAGCSLLRADGSPSWRLRHNKYWNFYNYWSFKVLYPDLDPDPNWTNQCGSKTLVKRLKIPPKITKKYQIFSPFNTSKMNSSSTSRQTYTSFAMLHLFTAF